MYFYMWIEKLSLFYFNPFKLRFKSLFIFNLPRTCIINMLKFAEVNDAIISSLCETAIVTQRIILVLGKKSFIRTEEKHYTWYIFV